MPENKDMFKNDGACQKDTGNFVSQIWDQKNVLNPLNSTGNYTDVNQHKLKV